MPQKLKTRTARKAPQPPKVADLPDLITIDEYIQATRTGRSSAYGLVREGKLPVVRLGRLIRIPRSALEAGRVGA